MQSCCYCYRGYLLTVLVVLNYDDMLMLLFIILKPTNLYLI